jgi:hypothetical protein
VLFDAADPFGLDQQLLNAFYAAGMARDILYYLGFREADGNAQVVNWDRGGLPNDRPDIRIAAGPAYAFTPVDGQIPTIVLGTEASTGRPHALDATVVIHEYTHILTNRLVGGPLTWGTLDAAQSQGLSEGWSDYVPCTLFNIDVIGAWVSNNPNGQRGIPYDSNYPGTFGSLGIGWYDERLFTGQIWAATLLEMARHADRSILLQVVVDSLKLVVPNPNFLQARDAMYLALTNMQTANRVSAAQASAVRSAMQSAFARFGMGQNAVSLGNLLRYITPDFILNGQSLKPPVKVIGLGGVSPDGTAAYAQGNDGSLWRNLSGTWTQALAPGFPQQRFWKVYRITSGGAQAIVFGESSTWGESRAVRDTMVLDALRAPGRRAGHRRGQQRRQGHLVDGGRQKRRVGRKGVAGLERGMATDADHEHPRLAGRGQRRRGHGRVLGSGHRSFDPDAGRQHLHGHGRARDRHQPPDDLDDLNGRQRKLRRFCDGSGRSSVGCPAGSAKQLGLDQLERDQRAAWAVLQPGDQGHGGWQDGVPGRHARTSLERLLGWHVECAAMVGRDSRNQSGSTVQPVRHRPRWLEGGGRGQGFHPLAGDPVSGRLDMGHSQCPELTRRPAAGGVGAVVFSAAGIGSSPPSQCSRTTGYRV